MIRIGNNLKYALLCILVCFNYLISSAQGIKDSLFLIPEVEVSGQRIFEKENAGMKQTRVDSIILMQKINADLSTLLSENTSVYIKNYGRGALATTSFRGTAPSHTQVSWNGIKINSPMLGMVDFSLIPVYIIDDMSLQHGAASVGQQSGGLGGHISIENNVNWKDTLSGRYIQSVGSFSTFDEFGQLNIGNTTIQSKTRAYHSYSKNDYPFTNKMIIPFEDQRNENADYGRYGFMQELYYRPMGHILVSAKVWGQSAYRSLPTANTDESSDGNKKKENRQNDNTLKAVTDFTLFKEKTTFKASTGIDLQELTYFAGYTTNNDLTKQVDSKSDIASWYNSFSLNYNPTGNLSFDGKATLNRFDINSNDQILLIGYDVMRYEGSVFFGTSYELNPHLQINGNLRKEYIEKRATPLIYALGINYKPLLSQNLVLKGSAVRNFHAATLNDLYFQPSGNPELKSEKGYTYEGGISYGFGDKLLSINSEITGYYSEINNWIAWIPDNSNGTSSPTNYRRVDSKGLEISIEGKAKFNKTHFYINTNYAYTSTVNQGEPDETDDISKGKQLPFIPVHSGNVFMKAENSGYYIEYQHNAYSEIYSIYTNSNAYAFVPYFMNSLSLGKHWQWKQFNFDATLKVNNLFDENYKSAMNRYMPGRNYMVMLKVEF